ncbi:MAG: hypothetical protein HY240_06960 [Actinobacteria bacterium]|nr:hypothetical protein [Actinomycetota bacterium]
MGYAAAAVIFGALIYLNVTRLRRGLRESKELFPPPGRDDPDGGGTR